MTAFSRWCIISFTLGRIGKRWREREKKEENPDAHARLQFAAAACARRFAIAHIYSIIFSDRQISSAANAARARGSQWSLKSSFQTHCQSRTLLYYFFPITATTASLMHIYCIKWDNCSEDGEDEEKRWLLWIVQMILSTRVKVNSNLPLLQNCCSSTVDSNERAHVIQCKCSAHCMWEQLLLLFWGACCIVSAS